MGSLLGPLITAAAQARSSYLGGQREGQDRAKQDALAAQLMARQQEKDKLADAIAQGQAAKLRAETIKLGQPTVVQPRNIDPNSPEGIAAANARWDYQLKNPKPVASSSTGEPNEVTVGPDGKRVYTRRSEAPGMEAPAPAERAGPGEDRTLVQIQQPDGSVVYVPRAQAAGQMAPQRAAMGSAALKKAVASNQTQMTVIDDALKELGAHSEAVGLKRGLGELPFMGTIGDTYNQRKDPAGVAARAQLANVGSLIIHDRSGAAVTVSEYPRLAPFVPKVTDTPEAIRIKLGKLREALMADTKAIEEQLGIGAPAPASGAPPDATTEAAWAAKNPPVAGESFEAYHARYLKSKGGP